ncbi:hypothetical protein PGT21_019935 [Puccinia graminis f. sp. tritici]|uniref:Hydrophobin n=1 Tax=Puccinia graminis f. sp. tritici TaxID=56615 RepID=A0A5B0N950_PUCGR|nr:hypothetical protein PGT21_019935 [Puccinia graminis f. sp. tritici]KAA1112164.1 hypothetical protein PGTUg99_013762 [Puccinia graminis f. sp. tritici]
MQLSTLFKFLLVALIHGEAGCQQHKYFPCPSARPVAVCAKTLNYSTSIVISDASTEGQMVELVSAHTDKNGNFCESDHPDRSCCPRNHFTPGMKAAKDVWLQTCPL